MIDSIFLGSKITVDSDCSHKIKRCLLLGRKAMISLDSVLKSKDNTLPTNACIISTIVFPVVMYSCESCTERRQSTKELIPSNCGAGEDSWKSLGHQGDQPSQSWEKSTLNTHWKDWCWSWSSSILVIWSNNQLIGKVPDAGKDGGNKRVTEDEVAGWHHWCNGHEFGQTSGVGEGQGGLACCSPWGCKEPDTTGQLNNNNLTWNNVLAKIIHVWFKKITTTHFVNLHTGLQTIAYSSSPYRILLHHLLEHP